MTKTNPFHNLKLDLEEQAIENDLVREKYQSIKNLKSEKKKLQQAANFTLSKTKNINIRLAEKDVVKLKVIAAKEGLPYQTLVASVLHKYTIQAHNLV